MYNITADRFGIVRRKIIRLGCYGLSNKDYLLRATPKYVRDVKNLNVNAQGIYSFNTYNY